ncbi:hypothetical protein VHEMI07136 [[Torrubiella] hemipterigena]|uniref:Methyltransferase domain-containing protein n=1 Tax=[Torrubiella] hemipterigena TaxID=1531966 RepID=A0A0A1TKS4_9HYPO|nr:hypothetical protein VHEMI07136 [[Torrubiella] hemipterigena]
MSTVAEANQQHFNKAAADYDNRYKETLGRIENELRDNLDLIGIKQGGRLLDYACGTGLLSRTFQSHVGQTVGIDISENMVEMFNANAAAKGLTKDQCYAYFGNLIDPSDAVGPPSLAGPEFQSFDVAGVGAGFHHFDDTILAATRLGERLKSGGTFFIVDFLPHAPLDHGHAGHHSVQHNGFSEDNTKELFDKAGLGKDFAFKKMDTVFEMKRGDTTITRHCFLARGTRI